LKDADFNGAYVKGAWFGDAVGITVEQFVSTQGCETADFPDEFKRELKAAIEADQARLKAMFATEENGDTPQDVHHETQDQFIRWITRTGAKLVGNVDTTKDTNHTEE
jgi:hypothetical protein